jgi:hypothetical protein
VFRIAIVISSMGLCLMMLVGCGEGAIGAAKVKTVPFTGKITIDGQPASGISVQFLPKTSDGGARSAYAEVKPDGTFAATTYVTGDGIVPGSYSVKAGKEADGASTDPAEMMAAVAGMAIDEIDIEVPADGLTDVELKMTSKSGANGAGGPAMLGN